MHVIFSYKGKNHLIKKEIRCKDDVYTHVYTLVVKPDNKYEVLIDNEVVESGDLEADWDFLAPKKIKVCEISICLIQNTMFSYENIGLIVDYIIFFPFKINKIVYTFLLTILKYPSF